MAERVIQQGFERTESWVQKIPKKLGGTLRPYAPAVSDLIERVEIDSPLVLVFAALCSLIHLLNATVWGSLSVSFFACPPLGHVRPTDVLDWLRVSCLHIFGHASWEHLNGNMVNLLLVGPPCERHFGSFQLLKIVGWTSSASGIAHILLGRRNTYQLGASGVVFMLILLQSLISVRSNSIPLTFVVQACLWVGKEVFSQIFGTSAQVSHIAHLSGAVVGTVAGYYLHGQKQASKVETICRRWAGMVRLPSTKSSAPAKPPRSKADGGFLWKTK